MIGGSAIDITKTLSPHRGRGGIPVGTVIPVAIQRANESCCRTAGRVARAMMVVKMMMNRVRVFMVAGSSRYGITSIMSCVLWFPAHAGSLLN